MNQANTQTRQGNHTAQRAELTTLLARRNRHRKVMGCALGLVAAAATAFAFLGL